MSATVFASTADAVLSGTEAGNRQLYRIKIDDEERVVLASSNQQAVNAMVHECFAVSVEIVSSRELYEVVRDVMKPVKEELPPI